MEDGNANPNLNKVMMEMDVETNKTRGSNLE